MLLLDAQSINALDRQAIAQMGFDLMAAAGQGLAKQLLRCKIRKNGIFGFVCGRGNNGGDGLIAARHLAKRGNKVLVFLLGHPPQGGGAQQALAMLKKSKIPFQIVDENPKKFPWSDLGRCAVIVDGIFGTGLEKRPGEPTAEFSVIRGINRLAREKNIPVIAIDIPSGLEADTGVPVVSRECCIAADHTITMGFAKPGLLGDPGYQYAGKVIVVPLPYPRTLLSQVPQVHEFIDGKNQKVGKRPRAAHKGQYGHCLIIAGSSAMPGALQLCVEAALTSGVGKVTAICPGKILKAKLLKNCPEAMWRAAETDQAGFISEKSLHESLTACERILKSTTAFSLVIGPGMGNVRAVWKWVEGFLHLQQVYGFPMVIDADALNAWATFPLDKKIPGMTFKAPVLLTPHVAELARLLGQGNAQVRDARYASVQEAIHKLQAWVILKGFRSLLGGTLSELETFLDINASGNPGMAKPGMGDVLSGILGARLAGMDFQATQPQTWRQVMQLAVYVHGRSGDLAAQHYGEESVRASHVIEFLPQAWKERQA